MPYQSYWGLRESPFRNLLDTGLFYSSGVHEEALARLQFLVEQRRRLGLLTGPSGSGKSLLLEMLAEQLHRRAIPVAKLSLLGLEPAEFLWQLAVGWGCCLRSMNSPATLWRVLTDRLVEFRYQQLEAVALLDDADQAGEDVMQHVARLVRFDPKPEMRLTIILSGRNISNLDERLSDQAELRIEVQPWSAAETGEFLQTQLARYGRQSPIFATEAIQRLHDLSHGIPRRAAQLADLALVAGAGANLPQIDADTIDAVVQELGVCGG